MIVLSIVCDFARDFAQGRLPPSLGEVASAQRHEYLSTGIPMLGR